MPMEICSEYMITAISLLRVLILLFMLWLGSTIDGVMLHTV